MRARNAGADLQAWGVILLLLLLLTAHRAPYTAYAACDRSYTRPPYVVDDAAIHTADANYYRGGIYTFDQSVGLCSVTAYLAHTPTDSYWSTLFHRLRVWTVDATGNLLTLLGTSDSIYQDNSSWRLVSDDNATAAAVKFSFYDPLYVPAGRIAITVSDNNGTAHPANYISWYRGTAQTGQQACAWAKPSLAAALDTDNTALVWTTGGDAAWGAQTATTKIDGDAVLSGKIGDSQTTWIQTTVTGPGTLRFWWKVKSEASYDYLTFYRDTLTITSISGDVDWTQYTYTVPSGSVTLKWTYAKNASTSYKQDCAWLDGVQWTPSGQSDPGAGYYYSTPIPGVLTECTSDASPLMDFKYVHAPYVTADSPSTYGMRCFEIPEWGGWFWTEDNSTLIQEMPSTVTGVHRIKVRQNDSPGCDNMIDAHTSGWATLRYRKRVLTGGTTAIDNHPSGDATATITGDYR